MSLEDITATLEGRHYIPPQDGARFIGGAAMSAETWPKRAGRDTEKEKARRARRGLRAKLIRMGHDNRHLLTLTLEQLKEMLGREMPRY
jgi:hypothetical protein